MGGAASIISTVASVASVLTSRKERATTSADKALAGREAEEKRRIKERRDRLAEQKEAERERAELSRQQRTAQSRTIATSGAGLLGQADVTTRNLKQTLGE